MTEWLQLSKVEGLLNIQKATVRSGISRRAKGKDCWVALALKAVFQKSCAKHILFKGWTSLSKCQYWQKEIDKYVCHIFV